MKKAFVIVGEEAMATRVDKAYREGGLLAVRQVRLQRLKEMATKDYVSPMNLAEVAAVAGEREEAMKYLKQAFEQRDPLLVHLQHDPDLDSLHSDPRYWAIVKKMGMPPLQ